MGLGKKIKIEMHKIACEWSEVFNGTGHKGPCDGHLMPLPSIGVNGPCKMQNPNKVLQTL